MHKTFTVILAIVALAGLNTNAFADGGPHVVTHVVNRAGDPPLVSLRARGPMVSRDDSQDAGLIKIANNITKYPNSPYYGWLGYQVFGPDAYGAGGTENFLATAFTPKANHLATKVEVAALYLGGTGGIVLSIYDDAAGVPGKALHSWHVAKLPAYICCTVVSGSDSRGVALTGGKQYWVVISTSAKDPTSQAAWALTEYANIQKHGASWALYCNGPRCPSSWKNPGWNIFTHMLYGLAFSVLGT